MINKLLIALTSIALTVIVFGIVTGNYTVLGRALVFDSLVFLLVATLVAVAGLLIARKKDKQEGQLTCLPTLFGGLCVLALIYGSDYPERNFVYPLVENPFWTAPLIGIVILLGDIAFSSKLAKDNFLSIKLLSPLLLIVFQALILVSFLSYADGRLIFSDDHPSFLYRLQMLVKNFPNIPFYNTDWNGGYSAQEFYPTGVLNFFFLTFPFFYLSEITSVQGAAIYTTVLGIVFIIVQPWLTYFAARLIGLTKVGGTLAAIIVLAPSLGYFEWLLKYGTISFLLSVALFPLVFALCWRVLFCQGAPKWRDTILLIITSTLTVFWSGAFFMLLPLLIFGILQPKFIFQRERRFHTLTFAILFLFGLSLWLPTFIQYSKVLNFVSSTALPGVESAQQSIFPSIEKLTSQRIKGVQGAVKVHPLLFALFIPGLFAISNRSLRVLFSATILWLFLLSLFGNAFKPQLELHRMIIPAAFLLALLAGLSLEQGYLALRNANRKGLSSLVASLCGYLLIAIGVGSAMIAPYVAYAAYTNQTIEKFKFAPSELETLSEAIKEHGGEGRTFFSGFILHELGTTNTQSQDGGHIAPLPTFSGKQLYAFDFYHRRWSTVDPIPASFRADRHAGIERFFDLLYVTAVVTFKPEWRDYCQRHPEIYQEVYQSDRFRLFKRRSNSESFIMSGKGQVRLIERGLEFTPDPTAGKQEVILRYRHLPYLKVTPESAATIEPHFVFDDHKTATELEPYNFIKLKIHDSAAGAIRITF